MEVRLCKYCGERIYNFECCNDCAFVEDHLKDFFKSGEGVKLAKEILSNFIINELKEKSK